MSTATILEALGQPTRLRIVDALLPGELPVQSLVERLGLSQPVVSKQLRTLRDAGLVAVRPVGQQRFYRLRPEPLAEIDAWLAPYRAMWELSLDKLEAHLASQPDPRGDSDE